MIMEFKKYGSILNWSSKQADYAGLIYSGDYHVFEKVHGANLDLDDNTKYGTAPAI